MTRIVEFHQNNVISHISKSTTTFFKLTQVLNVYLFNILLESALTFHRWTIVLLVHSKELSANSPRFKIESGKK